MNKAPVDAKLTRGERLATGLRVEHDYKINLKVELEIRHLHEKVDHLLNQHWTRLRRFSWNR